jgi:hypothetical protein
MYQAVILVNDMAKSNNSGIEFVGGAPLLDNCAGDCLRLQRVDGGYEAVLDYWKGWQGLTVEQVHTVWVMAGMLLKNCSVEID